MRMGVNIQYRPKYVDSAIARIHQKFYHALSGGSDEAKEKARTKFQEDFQDMIIEKIEITSKLSLEECL